MSIIRFTDQELESFLSFLKNHTNIYIGIETDRRKLLEVDLWMALFGSQWRLLSSKSGIRNSVY